MMLMEKNGFGLDSIKKEESGFWSTSWMRKLNTKAIVMIRYNALDVNSRLFKEI